MQRREHFDVRNAANLLIFASLKFKSGIANLKEEELEAVVHRCSSKQMFLKLLPIFRKTSVHLFLMFSGGRETAHWERMS